MSSYLISDRSRSSVLSLFTAFALSLLTVLVSNPVLADADEPGTISLVGVGEVSARPDMATVATGVVSEAKTARAALSANTAAMTSVIEWLKAAGIEDRDIQTSGFSVQPRYTQPEVRSDGQRPPPELVGYSVSNQVTIRVRDIAMLGDILDHVVSQGSNRINGVSFTFSEPEKLMDIARANAMADAIRRAKLYTEAAGIGLGRITNISENGGYVPQPQYRARAEMSMVSAPVPMEAGEQTLSVNLSVTWELDQ